MRLDNLKLRVGYGVTGTASIDPYTSTSHLDQSYFSLGGQKVLAQHDDGIALTTETLLMFAARAEHLAQVIRASAGGRS